MGAAPHQLQHDPVVYGPYVGQDGPGRERGGIQIVDYAFFDGERRACRRVLGEAEAGKTAVFIFCLIEAGHVDAGDGHGPPQQLFPAPALPLPFRNQVQELYVQLLAFA